MKQPDLLESSFYRVPTNEIQTHHMTTDRGHFEADSLTLETASVVVHGAGTIEPLATCTIP